MARVGSMRCPVAALSPSACDVTDAAVSLSSGGQLGYRCHKCGASGFFPKGSRSFRAIEALYDRDEADAPAPAAPAAPAVADLPAPAPAKPARKGFSMFS